MFKFFEKRKPPASEGITIFPAEVGNENPTLPSGNDTVIPESDVTKEKAQEPISSKPMTAEEIVAEHKETTAAVEPRFDVAATARLIDIQKTKAELEKVRITGNERQIRQLEERLLNYVEWLDELKRHGFIPAQFSTTEDLEQVRAEISRLETLPQKTERQEDTLRLLTKLHNEKILDLTNKLRYSTDFPDGSLESTILEFKAEMRAAEAAGDKDLFTALALEVEGLYEKLYAQKQTPETSNPETTVPLPHQSDDSVEKV